MALITSILIYAFLKGTLSGLTHFLAKENTLKMIKMLFLLSRYLNFCADVLVRQLDWKGKNNFKVYDVTTLETKNYNASNCNIPKSKGNQTMKHSQLIEYNITYAHFSRKIT